MVEISKAILWNHLQEVSRDKPHYNVGLIGVNDGRGAIFAFVDCWADENELHHHVFVSPKEAVEKLEYKMPAGHSELEPLHLDENQIAQIIAFLKTLDSPINADPKWLSAP